MTKELLVVGSRKRVEKWRTMQREGKMAIYWMVLAFWFTKSQDDSESHPRWSKIAI
jgi:hypothetical protein